MSKLLLQTYIGKLPEQLRDPTGHLVDKFILNSGDYLGRLEDKKLLQALVRVFAISPYAAEICLRDPACLVNFHETKDLYRPYQVGDFDNKFNRIVTEVSSQMELTNALGYIRAQEMLRIIFRALMGWSELEETMRELSLFAEHCILITLRLVNGWQAQQWGTPSLNRIKNLGLGVIAVGKLGGIELNFSSDIDLIFVYPHKGNIKEAGGHLSYEHYFTRLVQRVIQVLTATTPWGRLFRVDLRLRPFGASGPLVISFPALQAYYQQQGRDWERYAWIKARVLGLTEYQWAEPLQRIVKPFVYRKYIDYGAIEVLRSIKQLMLQAGQGESIHQDLKRGDGGIREIEFIAQALQLIQGGQVPAIQVNQTLTALSLLAQKNLLSPEVVADLVDAYYFLRDSEHILQMIADRQTHRLPKDEIDKLRLAYAAGFATWDEYYEQLEQIQNRVKAHFNDVLGRSTLEESAQSRQLGYQLQAVWEGSLGTGDSGQIIKNVGFSDVDEVMRSLEAFKVSKRIQLLHQLTKSQLNRLIPTLLKLIGKCNNSVETLHRVLMLLENIIRRSAYFALLLENPEACKYLVKLFSASLWIAEHVSLHPSLLAELLNSDTLTGIALEGEFAAKLDQVMSPLAGDDLETQLEAIRYFKLCQVFRIASSDALTTLALMQVSNCLSALAETILRKVQQIVYQDKKQVAVQAEEVPLECDFAIIAYGKLGGIELSYDSDLDLVFLHNHAPIDQALIIRVAQRIVRILNTSTRTGRLYAVDTRLRPSGEAGLLVSQIDAYIDYQQNKAWTWEQQALVRARAISGSPAIISKFEMLRCAVLRKKRDVNKLRREITLMRRRMQQQKEVKREGLFDIKQGRGGIIDLEFIVQFMVLAWAVNNPSIVKYTDNIRILESIAQEKLMPKVDVEFLVDAYKKYRFYVHQGILQKQSFLIEEQQFRSEREGVIRLWKNLLGQGVKS